MAKINLSEAEITKIVECIESQSEVPEEILVKLSPGFFEKLRSVGKFDFKTLDRMKIPSLEYAGKRSEAAILAQAALSGGAAPLQIVRSFENGEKSDWKNLIVQGDNLQFLKTCYLNQDPLIKDKVKGKVKLFYNDPPFGTGDEYGGKEGEMSYSAKLNGAEYIESLRERFIYCRELLADDGCMFVRIDYHFGNYIKLILDDVMGLENFRNEFIVKRGQSKAGFFKQFTKIKSLGVSYDNLYWYSKKPKERFNKIYKEASEKDKNSGKWMNLIKAKAYDRPTMRYEILGIDTKAQWMWSKDRAFKAVKNYEEYLDYNFSKSISLEDYWSQNNSELEFVRRNNNQIQYWIPPRDKLLIDNNWMDIKGYDHITNYPTENSEEILERVLQTTNENDLVMDIFGGSGTTASVSEKMGRRWIVCDFGKHSIYTMQRRIINISESKDLLIGSKVIYGKPPNPFYVVSSGAYDFNKILDLRKHKGAYISFVLGLFNIQRENKDYSKKYKINNVYAEKDDNPVEIYPIWDEEYLKNIRIDEEYLNDIVKASGNKLKGDYYIITPETCTVISDTTLKNDNNENVNFKFLKYPYKVLEDVSRQFQIQEQAASVSDINKLISSTSFYFNQEVIIKTKRANGGVIITDFKTNILNKNKEKFEGLDGLALILVDMNYNGKLFEMKFAIYNKDIKEGIVKIDDLTDNTFIIAIDKHGNESKPVKI